MRRLISAGTFMAAALFLSTSSAQAALICNNCTYQGNPATYLGVLNPTTNDQATFDHTSVPTGTVINDMWVFDIAPGGNGSASANFTVAAPFTGFTGGIYASAAPTVCAGAAGTICASATLGALLAGDTSADPQVVSTILLALAPGRYIFRLQVRRVRRLAPTPVRSPPTRWCPNLPCCRCLGSVSPPWLVAVARPKQLDDARRAAAGLVVRTVPPLCG